MSDSSIETSTCICERSCAIENSCGVLKLAATVWPASICREITTPSTGATIEVRARSTRAVASAASRCLTVASALATPRLGGAQLRLGRAHRLRGALLDEHRLVELGGGDEALGDQHLLAVGIALAVVGGQLRAQHLRLRRRDVAAAGEQRRPGGVEVGLGLPHLELEGLGVDAREDLALLHRRVEVDVEVLDLARHLRADQHRGDRVERPRRRHHGRDRRRARPWPCGTPGAVSPRSVPPRGGRDDAGGDERGDEPRPAAARQRTRGSEVGIHGTQRGRT